MARRTLWNVPCTGHHRDGSPCRAWSIRGGYVCRFHGGATRQARRLAAYRLWRAGIWERAGRDAAMRLGSLDERLDAGSACLPHGCGHGGRDDPGRAFRRAPQAPPEALAGQARTGQARPGRAAPQPDQVSRPEAAAVRPPRSRWTRPPSSSRNSSAGASVNSSPPWGGSHGRRQASRNGPASASPAPCASPQAVRVPGRHRA
jgi:hypothetical protein